nr:uncharacterized protein LOC127296400 isoform X2 [Lolium perenne]XP_051182423.1 uncharacterized protein LOC127296400 isoform X3 [Lolium perenne]
MRLIVLVMPLQGIVPGRCESPPRSPFLLQPRRCYPSNSSPFVLLRSNEPHHRLPGHPHGPFSGGALTSPSPASDPPRRGASTTPSASSRLSLPRQIRARLDLCHGVSVPELRLVLGQKGLASSSKQKPNVYLSDPWMGQGPAFSPAPALYPAPAAGQIRPRTAQHLLLSRIGSRSGAVRYAKSSGCSSASYNRQAFPLYFCPCRSRSPILFCLLPHAILKLRSCHVSLPLVTSSSPYCHHHLLRLLFGY